MKAPDKRLPLRRLHNAVLVAARERNSWLVADLMSKAPTQYRAALAMCMYFARFDYVG